MCICKKDVTRRSTVEKKTQTSECKLMYTHDFQVNARSQETSQTQYQQLKKKGKQIKQNKADLQQSI